MTSSEVMVVLVNYAHPRSPGCGSSAQLPSNRESSIDIGATSAADTANVGNTVVVSLATELYIS